MIENELLTEITEDGVMILTLNFPGQMNALSRSIHKGIYNALNEVKENDNIKVILLTGAGRVFCSGADLGSDGVSKGDKKVPGRSVIANKRGPNDLIIALANCDVPLIGAINGAAVGAGLGLALAMDIRIASDKARFGSVFIKRGLAPDFGTSFWLPRIVGMPKSFEMLYSGDFVKADEALDIGLVNRVVPHDSLFEEGLAYARRIASGPPIAYTYTRRAIHRSGINNLEEQLIFEWTQQTELLRTDDAKEGFKAFFQKRDPVFKGF